MSTTGQGRRLAGQYVPAAKFAPNDFRSIVETSIEGGPGGRSIP